MNPRRSLLDMDPEEFRALGHQLIDQLADFYRQLPTAKVTPGESPAEVRAALGDASLPETPTPNAQVLADAKTTVTAFARFEAGQS